MSLVFFLGEGGIAYLQCTESGIQSALNMRGHPCRWAQVGPKDPQPFGFPALTDLQAAAERACGPGPAQTPGCGDRVGGGALWAFKTWGRRGYRHIFMLALHHITGNCKSMELPRLQEFSLLTV